MMPPIPFPSSSSRSFFGPSDTTTTGTPASARASLALVGPFVLALGLITKTRSGLRARIEFATSFACFEPMFAPEERTRTSMSSRSALSSRRSSIIGDVAMHPSLRKPILTMFPTPAIKFLSP